MFVVRIIFIIILVGTCSYSSDYNKYFGLGLGFSSGMGLSYRHWINKTYGFQVNMLPYYKKEIYNEFPFYKYDEYDGYQKKYWLSIGATAMRSFSQFKHGKGFLYLGTHLIYDREDYSYYDTHYKYSSDFTRTGEVVHHKENIVEKLLVVGIGPGFEIWLWRLSLSLMFGFAANTDFDGTSGVSVTGETGLHYKF